MKWIKKIVERITSSDAPLNNSFRVNQHKIDCQSGMRDFVCVIIDNLHHFSFDFWTKELCRDNTCRYWEDITQAFKEIYENIKVIDNFKTAHSDYCFTSTGRRSRKTGDLSLHDTETENHIAERLSDSVVQDCPVRGQADLTHLHQQHHHLYEQTIDLFLHTLTTETVD